MSDPSSISSSPLSIRRLWVTTIAVLLAATLSWARPPDDAADLDEAAFRQGLRERGLTEWLDQYLKDTPPADAVDARLRQYEVLLAEADQATVSPAQRETMLTQADEILAKLIDDYPSHQKRMRWSMGLARHLLERRDRTAFDAVLLYELPGRRRARVYALSSEAVDVLIALRAHVAQQWKSLEALDENTLNAVVEAGKTRELERVDADSMLLLTWAQLHEALSGGREATFDELLMRITNIYRWHELPNGHEHQRAHANVMAAIAARKMRRFTVALQHVRQATASARKLTQPGQREQQRSLLLLARLEHVRTLRDSGRFDQALDILRELRAREDKSNFSTALAITLAECGILAAQTDSSRSTTRTLLQPPEVLAPLQTFAFESVRQRDRLYAALVGAFDSDSLEDLDDPLAAQFVLGSALTDALARQGVSKPAENVQLEQAMTAAQHVLTTAAIRTPAAVRGELLYLLGCAREIVGDRPASIQTLLDLADQYPEHGRTAGAVSRAMITARIHLTQSPEESKADARSLFIRSGRTLRRLQPDSPEARQMQYFIALATEHNEQYEQADKEYALVSPSDANALKAALGRVRCLQQMRRSTTDASKVAALMSRTIQAATQGAELARQLEGMDNTDRCIAGEIILTLVTLLNDDTVNKPAEAVAALRQFEDRFKGCDTVLGPALRERIRALQQLNQLGQAREAIEEFVTTNPQAAGPVMAALLEAMRSEINAAADRDQPAMVKHLAIEAAALTEKLIRWSEQHADSVESSDMLTMRAWYAWSLLHADRHVEALKIYDECLKTDPERLPAPSALRTEIRLGRAQCLLQLDRPEEALPIFTEIWHTSFEHSPNWWQAFVGSLEAHTHLGSSPERIIQSIRQQELLAPNLGGPRYKHRLKQIETANNTKMGKQPNPNPPDIHRDQGGDSK